MKIKVLREYGVKSWITPNYVNAMDAGGDTVSIPLSEVSAEDLSLLCDQWRAEVFKTAGKPDPRLTP